MQKTQLGGVGVNRPRKLVILILILKQRESQEKKTNCYTCGVQSSEVGVNSIFFQFTNFFFNC